MAIPIVAPRSQSPSVPDDLVTYRVASALLRDSPYPASEHKVGRWVRRYHIRIWSAGAGKAHLVSFTDVVKAQRDEAIRLDRAI
ncbi:hypothetical protein TPA0910_86970 [Streptomyces hygroscopicus subsp. sporocinereus]|uniref:Integrase n=1 Tax=Streptomyces hygroscopicus TaxID=1912 RepID=A0ABQ3UF90_STRHY|nr:hypothetical protein TPA0910_86970 [Streptomyces hygroscopicus]